LNFFGGNKQTRFLELRTAVSQNRKSVKIKWIKDFSLPHRTATGEQTLKKLRTVGRRFSNENCKTRNSFDVKVFDQTTSAAQHERANEDEPLAQMCGFVDRKEKVLYVSMLRNYATSKRGTRRATGTPQRRAARRQKKSAERFLAARTLASGIEKLLPSRHRRRDYTVRLVACENDSADETTNGLGDNADEPPAGEECKGTDQRFSARAGKNTLVGYYQSLGMSPSTGDAAEENSDEDSEGVVMIGNCAAMCEQIQRAIEKNC